MYIVIFEVFVLSLFSLYSLHTYIYIYIYTHIIYAYLHIHTYTYIHTYIYIHTYRQAYMHTYILHHEFRSPGSADCPPEVRDKCLTSAGKRKSTAIMRQMYEMFLTCDGDWMASSLVVNSRKRNSTRRRGRYVWKKYELLKTEHLCRIVL